MASIAEKILGHWKLSKNEGWDEFMQACGVGMVLRKVGNTVTSVEEWKVDGDQWTLSITSTFKSKSESFKMGEEFIQNTADGRKVKSTFTIESNKIVLRQMPTQDGEVQTTVTREITEDGNMLMTCVAENKGGVTAKRYFAPHKP